MQARDQEKLNPDRNLYSETIISQHFDTQLKISNDLDLKREAEEAPAAGGDFEEGEEEFSFVCGGANTPPIAAEDAFVNGQIRPIFPLFNRDLLFYGEDSNALHENLPMRPPVKKVFVETSGESGVVTLCTPENDERAGPSCEWSDRQAVEASPEICKKSNSTGFSKIWRFKDLMRRSNSDGRDTFVFLNNGHAPPASPEHPATSGGEEKSVGKEASGKVTGNAKKKGKSKTAPVSAHEAYLKSKAKEEFRRRPYRPEVMGIFTTIHGGLTKNVHPF